MNRKSIRFSSLLLAILVLLGTAHAQFSSSLQGTVEDPSGAAVAEANVTLTNTATNVSQQTTSDSSGEYRFISIAPGSYTISAESKGFAVHKVSVVLQTNQTMNVVIKLSLSTQSQTVEVTDQAPVVDTAETRNQLTISTEAMDSLPLPGRNQLGLISLAPGVTGLGVAGSGGNGQSNDNYGSETQVSASANGRSSVGNMYVVDGLDITSNITPGVLNLVPNPDTIQEATVQVNTFNVEYGRSSSIVEVMTTRSGGNKYHFLASDYYTANWLTARTEFQPRETTKILPFHSNNISTTLSGPIPFLKQTFFFTGWEPLLSSTQSTSQITVEDPAFVTWAQQNWPNSTSVKLLAQYPSVNVSRSGSPTTASTLLGPSVCGTVAGANIPCNLAVVDNGVFNATNYRNGLQLNGRIDKVFNKDRLYANYYRTSLYLGGPSVRVGHGAPQQYLVRSVQGNETHTFNDHLLNEAGFGFLRMSGLINPTGPFHVPIITVSSAWNTQIGVGKAHENYVQHHFVWRDALSYVRGSHQIKAGYDGFHGDNLTFFGPWNAQPAFSFQTIAAFVQDQVFSETGLSYNLLTGQQAGLAGGSFQFTGNAFGFFLQDQWKMNRKLTLTYGLRWDDYGNPTPSDGFIAANFFYGDGATTQDKVANGYLKQVPHAFNQSITAWSPRVGVAYDVTGSGKWLVRGGFGLYHDWVTLGNVQSEFQNPPAPAGVTFQSNTTGLKPIYSVGTSDVYPFGFTYPSFAGYTLNSKGGITGQQVNIGGNDPDLKASNTMNYTVTLEHSLGLNYSVAATYSGAHSNNLFLNFGTRTTNAGFGTDINNFPGSLIQNNGTFVRLNTSFGTIRYVVNGPTATYNAFITEFKGRVLHHGFIDVSYTRSSSYDDAQNYPTVQSNSGNYSQYWAHSVWDVPNRLSLQASYELPHLRGGPGFLHYVTDGWKPSVIVILQSGQPFTVSNGNAYKVNGVTAVAGAPTDSTGSPGDYNADGVNFDLPNIPSYGYKIPTDRNHQLARTSDLAPIPQTTNGAPTPGATGVFVYRKDFTAPSTLPGEGNEVMDGYRSPGYANTDFALLKNNRIHEWANLQLRLELFNLFNRASLGGINGSINSSNFGKATSQFNPRFLQLGARFEF